MSGPFILAKSANEWGANELDYFKIRTVETTLDNFLQHSSLPAIPSHLQSYVDTELDNLEDVEVNTLYARLHELHDADNEHYFGTAVDIFALHFLEMIHFTKRPVLMKMNLPLQLHFSGEIRSGNPNLAAVDSTELVSGFYQEYKRKGGGDKEEDIFGQLVAEGIAAFQHNEKHIQKSGDTPHCDLIRFPAMTMVGTSPTFYMANITTSLAKAVCTGNQPANVTCVYYCRPDPQNLGMQSIKNRRKLVSHFLASKDFKEITV
jgi:hypothetical protein